MNTNTENKCQEMAESIANNLEQVVSGEYYYDDNGNLVRIEDDSEMEPASLYKFFEDVYNIRWTVERDSNGMLEVVGGEIMVGCGGPNIWITNTMVTVHWGSESGKAYLSHEAKEAVLEYLREVFEF